jgi:HEAT repeat protein
MRTLPILAVSSSILLSAGPAVAGKPALADADRVQLVRSLEQACAKQNWIAIHAAEALIVLGHPEPVRRAFEPLAESAEPRYRIGVWRVLARCSVDEASCAAFTARIRATLLDERAPDRVHALEAMAKLAAPIQGDDERRAVMDMSRDPAVAPFAIWRLAQEHDPTAGRALITFLADPSDVARARAAYVIARLPAARAAAAPALAAALSKEPTDSPAHGALAAAAGGDALRRLASSASPAARYTAAAALAEDGTASDRALLGPLLKDEDEDVRVAAAFAVLWIDARPAQIPPATRPRP